MGGSQVYGDAASVDHLAHDGRLSALHIFGEAFASSHRANLEAIRQKPCMHDLLCQCI
jgi:hypothetical protein